MSAQVVKALIATVRLADGSYREFMRGDELPSNLADGQLERLKSLDAVGSADEVAALASPMAVATPEEDAAAALTAPDLSTLGTMSDEQLNALYAAPRLPTVADLLTAVGSDAALARRVLDAETAAAKGEPRKTLVEPLERVIGAGA